MAAKQYSVPQNTQSDDEQSDELRFDMPKIDITIKLQSQNDRHDQSVRIKVYRFIIVLYFNILRKLCKCSDETNCDCYEDIIRSGRTEYDPEDLDEILSYLKSGTCTVHYDSDFDNEQLPIELTNKFTITNSIAATGYCCGSVSSEDWTYVQVNL